MITPELLGVLGFIVTLLLGLNAYFIKELVDSINQVKIQTATLIENNSNTKDRLQSVEDDLEMIRARLHTLGNETQKHFLDLEVKIAKL